jgi:cytochrome c oxidase subunit 3
MLLSTYLVRQGWPDWHLLPRPGILWLNTFWLALSSGLIEWAKRSARRPDPGQWRAGFFSAGALALLFLIGQLAAWREMSAAGHLLGTTPASSFFYLLTALHAIHTWGGLVAWSWVAAKLVARTDVEVRARLGLCAIYWHFLLIVWLVILSLIWFTK